MLTLASLIAGFILIDRAERERIRQANEFQLQQLRQQGEQRLKLSHAAREDELLAHAEIQAGHFLEGAHILQRATELCAKGLQARFAKVLELLPEKAA